MEFSLAEVGPIADICCKCTGACKTTRCICRKNGHGCTLGKCKCKPSKCSQLKEQAAVDIAALGTEVHSSDSEPEDYCVCTDACDTTLCYCLAIKQKECESQCKCNPSVCENKVISSLASSSTPSSAPSTVTAQKNIEQEVKEFCATHSKLEMEGMLLSVVSRCPQLWKSIVTSQNFPVSSLSKDVPPWCKCGKCREESDLLDRICCKNHPKNHENQHFFQLCLDQQTLEVALINNCDWLNMPRIYTNAKYRNTAYRQYILWFYGRLGYGKRKRIPSCIKWSIRSFYPEPDNNYTGYFERL